MVGVSEMHLRICYFAKRLKMFCLANVILPMHLVTTFFFIVLSEP